MTSQTTISKDDSINKTISIEIERDDRSFRSNPASTNTDTQNDVDKQENVEENKVNKKESKLKCKGNGKDGGWGWVVVVASFFSHVLSDGVVYAYGVLAPEYIKHFGISRSTVGWMGSVLISVTLATGPLASYLCNVFSYRSVAIAGSIISAIGFSVPYFYSELWFLILSSSVICGIGFGLVYVPSIIIINVWFEKKRSLAIGIAVCGSGLGTFVYGYLLEFLISSYGWKMAMLISGISLLLLILCSLTYSQRKDKENKDGKIEVKDRIMDDIELNEVNEVKPERDLNVEENIKESNEVNKAPKRDIISIIKNPVFIIFLLSNVLSGIGFNAPYMFIKDRAMRIGINEAKSSFLISSIGIGNCLGRVGFGYLATLKVVNRFHLFNSATILSGLLLIVSWWMNNYVLMVIYSSCYGMLIGAFVTLTSVILTDTFGINNLDITFGLSLVFQGVAMLVGPPFAGFLYDTTLSFNISFAVCGLFIMLSGLIRYLSYAWKDFRLKKFH